MLRGRGRQWSMGGQAGVRPGPARRVLPVERGAVAVAQSDGNFVVYAGGKAKWDTATNGRKPSTGPSRYPKPAFVQSSSIDENT